MLFTASSDFVLRSLAHVQSVIGKVLYCASLFDAKQGQYVHWGLTRMYGEPAVQSAIADNHRDLLHTWLTMRMAETVDDLSSYREVKGVKAEEAMAQIKQCLHALPPNAQPDLALHCSLYLESLEQLTQAEHSAAA